MVDRDAIRNLRFHDCVHLLYQKEENKKKALNNPWILLRVGRGSFMLFEKNRQLSTHRFGELELVDKSLFFICTNRRDN